MAHKVWTREKLIAALREHAIGGFGPTRTSWLKKGDGRPTFTTVVNTFGSWNAGCHAAGLNVRKKNASRSDRPPRIPAPRRVTTAETSDWAFDAFTKNMPLRITDELGDYFRLEDNELAIPNQPIVWAHDVCHEYPSWVSCEFALANDLDSRAAQIARIMASDVGLRVKRWASKATNGT